MASILSSRSFDSSTTSSNKQTATTQGSSGSSSFDSHEQQLNNNTNSNNNHAAHHALGMPASSLALTTRPPKTGAATSNNRSQKLKKKRSKRSLKKKQQKLPEVKDEIGTAMARLLNGNPDFRFVTASEKKQRQQPQEEEQLKAGKKRGRNDNHRPFDLDDVSLSSFRPIFGPQNRYRMQVLTKCFWIVVQNLDPIRDIPDILLLLRECLTPLPQTELPEKERLISPENSPSLSPNALFPIVVASLVLLGCIAMATSAVFAAVYAWNFAGFLLFVVSSMLVDWNEISSVFPQWCSAIVNTLGWILLQFDRIILLGNRWRGREWSKEDGFDMVDSINNKNRNKPAWNVRDQYLWKIPPPGVLMRSLQMVPTTSRSSMPSSLEESEQEQDSTISPKNWGKDTREHVEAIDYCYIMMREEAIQTQYARLKKRKATLEDTTSNSSVDEYPIRQDLVRRASNVSSLESFRKEFVRNPSIKKKDGEEIDDAGISMNLQKLLEASDSFDDCDKNATMLNTSIDSDITRKAGTTNTSEAKNDDTESIGSRSEGTASDMNWMDVGTSIGLKLLSSSAVQKAMASHDTIEKIGTLKEKMDNHFSKDASSKSSATELDSSHLSPLAEGGTQPPTPYYDADGGLPHIEQLSPRVNRLNLEANDDVPSSPGYRPGPYAEAIPVHPMWTSAAAAVSPSHSLETMRTFETKGDSTIGSPETLRSAATDGDSLGSPPRLDRKASIVPSPVSASKPSPTSSSHQQVDTDSVVLSNIDILDVLPTPVQSNKRSTTAIIADSLPKVLTKKIRRRKRKKPKPETEPAIELVCNENGDHQKPIPQLSFPLPSSRHPLLLPGVKIAVPLLPSNPDKPKRKSSSRKHRKDRFQMGTVVSSKRICVYEKNNMPQSGSRFTNCLSITVNLDKCFLRNGQFATMTMRIMDRWGPRYMPKHSKLPMGSCVATSFGLGVLVGWRVEDDCHIVHALWKNRGSGTACAYLQRDSIHATMEAAVGFEANTTYGRGTIIGYVNGGPEFKSGQYYVCITEEGRHYRQIMQLNRIEVLSCESAKYIPILEHIRAAAQYQLQIDRYKELHDPKASQEEISIKMWGDFYKHGDILWKSFLKAIEEDNEFDDGMNEFVQRCVSFLDQLDAPSNGETPVAQKNDSYDDSVVIHDADSVSSHLIQNDSSRSSKADTGFWLTNTMFDIFQAKPHSDEIDSDNEVVEGIEIQATPRHRSDDNYARAFAIVRTLTRTVNLAKTACDDEPNFKLALSLCHEFLLFVKTVIQVQKKNMNPESLKTWRSSWAEIVSVFGPVHQRLKKIGAGIAERMEKHGRKAKVRLLRFVDIIVQDDVLFLALEQGDWTCFMKQLESAVVQAKIIDEQSHEHYRKTAIFLYKHFSNATSKNEVVAARNNDKLAKFLMAVQVFAAPRKSILELFLQDNVLEILERIFVRAFSKDEVASRMISIHCSNFDSLRRFRLLKDFTIAGKLWIPLLEAADEEFSWAVSKLPANAQEYLGPISSLFSLCVVQFHKINDGDLTKDWLHFLMDDDAADIIHDLDMKLILALESFSRDVKDTMVVLPYYPSIDDDILNLVDEVDVDEFVKEASVALEDDNLLRQFIREKATIMVERLLDYLPKLSIPVEKRDLGEGWCLTCRGAGGGDLTLTELNLKRENLTCQVLGGDSLLFPTAAVSLDEMETAPTHGSTVASPISQSLPMGPNSPITAIEETSILTVIKGIILNAQRDGCYQVGEGGISHPPTDKYAASLLDNLPVSSVLNCAIDLWRNLEIDDDELLEVAIRDISYQIEINSPVKDPHSKGAKKHHDGIPHNGSSSSGSSSTPTSPKVLEQLNTWQMNNTSVSLDDSFLGETTKPHRFNPRVDPTVLFLEIKKLTFNLENFLFRIEKHESKKTIFDPAFEGTGSILVKNVLIKLRVECYKGYIFKQSVIAGVTTNTEVAVPVLQLTDLDVSLEQVKLEVQDTGADWLLNKIVEGFGDKFAEIISANLCDQVRKQVEEALDNINGYFEENPDVLLGVLDICLDDLDEMTVFV